MNFLHNIDISVFYFVNQTCRNSFCDILAPYFTWLGHGWLLFAFAVVFLFFKEKEIKILGILLLAGLAISYYSFTAIKFLVSRPRPFMALENVHVLARPDGHSFPSGHATMIFMTAFLLTDRFKKWHIFYSLAALVALSRVYLGVHYPSDIIAGAALGAFLGFALVFVAEKAEVLKNRSENDSV
ncbi:MAG: phosphatase PAP2 family protein [Candidatus Omnitrophota bacterium]|jgi:undecaprenyl-diphosphatase